MWIVFGNRTKVRPIAGSIDREQHCPSCKGSRRFVECDVADQVSLFFVPVLDATTRRMVCTECGEDLDVSEVAVKAKVSVTPTKPVAPPVTDKELEKRLATLKKRMGKP